MDSNRNDESQNRRREETLARRLGEALDRAAPRLAEPCPDAELIAAYHEQAMGLEETARCEDHFAACSRCRKILAVLAASDDTPLAEKEVARLGELVAAARVPREVPSQAATPARPKLLDWHRRWLAPALGVAAVLAVWFAMRPPWRAINQGPSGNLIAQAPKNEPSPSVEAPPVDQFSKTAPANKPEAESATPSLVPKEGSDTKTESAQRAAETFAKKNPNDERALDAIAPDARVAESASGSGQREQPALNSALAGPPPPPPVAQPLRPLAQARPQRAGQAAPAAPGRSASTSQPVTVAGEAPMVQTTGGAAGNASVRDKQAVSEPRPVANLPLNGRNFQSLSTSDAGETAIQVRAPSEKVFWRLGKNGRIERSTDAGNSWILQTSPLQEEWLAGSAVSDTICWVAGRNGAIARTTDGEHWGKVASPSSSADASGNFADWTGITASDGQKATITGRNQRHYTTQDGGESWREQ